MLNRREIVVLLTSALVLGYLFKFPAFSVKSWLFSSLLALLILGVNVSGKKFVAFLYDSDARIDHWNLSTYGFWESMSFKKPFPTWIFVPLILVFVTLGYVKWLAIITFEASASSLRTKKSFSHMSDWDIALIAMGGILFTLVLAFFSRLFGFNDFATLNVLFALFSLVPFSTLDGIKIFFGSRFLWIFSVVFVVVMLLLFEITGLLVTLGIAVIIAAMALMLYYSLVEA